MDITKTNVQSLKNDCEIRLKAIAPIYAWNYFNNYPIDSDDMIYEKDLDLNEFKIKNDHEHIIIQLSGKAKHKIESLNQILNILFNEKSNEYDDELGYSGFKFEKAHFEFKDDNDKNIELIIDNFYAKVLKNN